MIAGSFFGRGSRWLYGLAIDEMHDGSGAADRLLPRSPKGVRARRYFVTLLVAEPKEWLRHATPPLKRMDALHANSRGLTLFSEARV